MLVRQEDKGTIHKMTKYCEVATDLLINANMSLAFFTKDATKDAVPILF